ncbi:MAG: hypothetical protein QXN93_01035 [Methanomassiliicoccales archaeon]
MKKEFIRCEFCKSKLPFEMCQLAAYSATIDGKEYVFCCKNCADRFEVKRKASLK